MIWNSIITGVLALLTVFINLFPIADSGVLAQISGSVAPFKAFLANADWLFPIQQFFIILQVVITLEAGIVAFKILHWLFKIGSAGFVK
jgi:hypothetical protein